MRLRLLNQLLQTAAVSLLLLFIVVLSYNSYAQSELQETGFCGVSDHNYSMVQDSLPSAAKGSDLWNENACGACHNKNMKVDATGPALSGVTERWQDYPRQISIILFVVAKVWSRQIILGPKHWMIAGYQ